MARAILVIVAALGAVWIGEQIGSQQRELSCVRDTITWQLICR